MKIPRGSVIFLPSIFLPNPSVPDDATHCVPGDGHGLSQRGTSIVVFTNSIGPALFSVSQKYLRPAVVLDVP